MIEAERIMKLHLDGWFVDVDRFSGMIYPPRPVSPDYIPDFSEVEFSSRQEYQHAKYMGDYEARQESHLGNYRWTPENRAVLKAAREMGMTFRQISEEFFQNKFTSGACQKAHETYIGSDCRENARPWESDQITSLLTLRSAGLGWGEIAIRLHRSAYACQTKHSKLMRDARRSEY